MPDTPVAFCSVHSSVIIRRTSLPFFAIVTTVRHALPAAGRAATSRAGEAPTNALQRAADVAMGCAAPRRADIAMEGSPLLLTSARARRAYTSSGGALTSLFTRIMAEDKPIKTVVLMFGARR